MSGKKFITIFLSLFIFFLTSCSPVKSHGKAEFGADCEYYMGLRALEKGNDKEAESHFYKAIKKGSVLAARRSAEKLCSLGDRQEKINAAKKLTASYTDDEALLFAARIYSEYGEPGLVLSLTSKIDVKTANDELVGLRLKAMKERKVSGIEDLMAEWYLNKPITSYHYKFFCEYIAEHPISKELYDFFDKVLFIINFRIEIYSRNYRTALLMSGQVESLGLYNPSLMTEQVMSDLGKSHLYESSDQNKSAKHFTELAETYKGTGMEFYCWFYAGRLYEKADANFTRISKCFDSAINSTEIVSRKDNALWYLLRASLQQSAGICLRYLKQYASTIGDANYYDDFFDLLCQLLLTEGRYKELGTVYKMIQGFGSKEAVSKFAYIYGRLIEERIYIPDDDTLEGRKPEEEKREAFKTALESGTDLYYRIRAAERLELKPEELKEVYCAPRKDISGNINPEAEKLLNGYAFFGFPEKIYEEWVSLGSPFLSTETAVSLCSLLRNCSKGNDDYYVQSLRIAAKCMNYNPDALTVELLKYCFPENYKKTVSAACKKYDVEEQFMFGLIRSESFFDPDVSSNAGAVGLCQLMPFTADEIAHKLRKSTYDITDAETNIEFGTYYFGNLLSRMEGNYLDACYSYNAGINKVRKWKKSSALGFNVKDVPEDLFLETLPYSETREYGRKCYSAATMYRWLYK